MSYVRFGPKSDVYVYQDIDFGLRCCACIFGTFDTRSRAEMIAHLEKHIATNHLVPEGVIERLRGEIAECGDDSPGAMHLAMDRRATDSGVSNT